MTRGWLIWQHILEFQSTPSLRKVTSIPTESDIWRSISIHTFLAEGDIATPIIGFTTRISIHTFLAEGDDCTWYSTYDICNFNPHLPCGRWLSRQFPCCKALLFQSTPSLRKVTAYVVDKVRNFYISIHTFLAEGDRFHPLLWCNFWHFNPHLPCGRWPDLSPTVTKL